MRLILLCAVFIAAAINVTYFLRRNSMLPNTVGGFDHTEANMPLLVSFGTLYFCVLPFASQSHRLCQLAVFNFVFQGMERSLTEQDREIRDIVKRADKNLDRTGAFVCSPLLRLEQTLIFDSYSDEIHSTD
jgi:hypothetical protein